MVGHHLQGNDFYLWIIIRNAPPVVGYTLAQLAEHNTRLVRVFDCGIATPNDSTFA